MPHFLGLQFKESIFFAPFLVVVVVVIVKEEAYVSDIYINIPI